MVRPDDPSIDHALALRPDGFDGIRRPLVFGGAEFVGSKINFADTLLRRKLNTKQSFEDYLQLRERAFKIAVTEMLHASYSPVDLFVFTDEDGKSFRDHYLYELLVFGGTSHDQSTIVDGQSNGTGADNNLTISQDLEDRTKLIQGYKAYRELSVHRLRLAQICFALRKGLLKLYIHQEPLDNDTEKALDWLQSSTGWSELFEAEIRLGLKGHKDFLKEHARSKMNLPSISEYENVALEKINKELGSTLDNILITFEAGLMGNYFNHAKLCNLARECAVQAQGTGVILVKQALPAREKWKEQRLSTSPKVLKLPSMKQTVNK